MAQVLYRKYRPQKFSDVLGQGHVVSILEKAVNANRVAHAYLFAGPRGIGKTSVARILAREAGCTGYDLFEIDAASSRGIDDIRELREAVRLLPFGGGKKVYIIDEVHMLTKEAFNALLKTLEEPPEHAMFILATTEPEKVPETIHSRCQTFTFRRAPYEILKRTVKTVAKREGYELDDDASSVVALLSEGSFRDALGYLDQILTLGKKVTGGEVREFLGIPAVTLVENLVDALIKKDKDTALNIVKTATDEGMDIALFIKLLLHNVRERALKDTDPRILDILQALLRAYSGVKLAYIPHLPLEIAVIELAR